MRTHVTSLYVLKAVCSIFIVFIHIHTFHEYELLAPLLRTAVPCFFMITGYFLVSEKRVDSRKVLRSLFKTIKITLFATAAYLLFFLVRYLLFGIALDFGNPWHFVSRWLLVGDNICFPFWYLATCIQSLLLLYCINRFKLIGVGKMLGVKKIDCLCATCFLLAVLFNRYSFLFGHNFDITWSRNCFLVGLPCLLLGARFRIEPPKKKINLSLTGILLVVLAYCELFILHYYGLKGSGSDYLLMTFPLSIFIFTTSISHPNLSSLNGGLKKTLETIGKHCATHIYLYHIMLFQIVVLCFSEQWACAELIIVVLIVMSLAYRAIRQWLIRHLLVQS